MITIITFLLFTLIQQSVGHVLRKPHIVLIIADDMGFNDVSFRGSDQIPTPNIDSLAYNGVILNYHYSMPMCTPSRAALLTGKHPIHLGYQGLPTAAEQPVGLPLSEKLLSEYMQEAGYSTHLVGKWHMGFYKPEYTPLARGFDSFLGFYNGLTSYYDHILESRLFSGYDMRRNWSTAWDLHGKYATDIFTDEAVSIIKSQPAIKPMFLYLAHTAVHSGNLGKYLEAPQESIDKFSYISNPNRRMYAGMVHKLDESVGNVVQALQEKDMLNNTIIVFISDNGSPNAPNGIFNNWGSNLPLRGEKVTLWEGGVRVPALVWSPLIEEPSRIENSMIHITDWMPTLLSVAGSAFGNASNIYGVNQWDTISKVHSSERTEVLVNMDEINNVAAVIDGDYKYIQGVSFWPDGNNFLNIRTVNESSPSYSLTQLFTSKAWKAVRKFSKISLSEDDILTLRKAANIQCEPVQHPIPYCNSSPCLFNLATDPCEQTNLVDQQPDVAESLKLKLQAYRATLVPQPQLPMDVHSNPKLFGGAWSPWK